MTVKKGKAQKKGRRIIIEDVDDQDTGGSGGASDPADPADTPPPAVDHFSDYRSDCLEHIAKHEKNGFDYTACLLKNDEENTSRWDICDQRQNAVLTLDQIGLSFGGGRYRIFITYEKAANVPLFSRRFCLHSSWSDRKREAERQAAQKEQDKKSGGLGGTIDLIRSVVDVITPMIPKPQPPIDMAASMIRQYDMLSDVLKKNLNENITLYRGVAERAGDMEGEAGGGGDGGGNDVLGVIMPLLDRYLPIILGRGKESQLTIETIKALPIFKKLMKDRKSLQKVISGIERKIGKPETDQLLASLGVSRG